MTVWTNSDGLHVKFARDGADLAQGGQYSTLGPLQCTEIKIDYTDALSATPACVGGTAGALNPIIPGGVRIENVEVIAETAFTSSGTIGSATFVLGLKKLDRSTELDHDGFTTSSFVGSSLDAQGEYTNVRLGVTGVGALIGATTSEAGYVCVSNSAHASHPYTAGKATVRIYWYNPQTIG
jgi:hypothetical protein